MSHAEALQPTRMAAAHRLVALAHTGARADGDRRSADHGDVYDGEDDDDDDIDDDQQDDGVSPSQLLALLVPILIPVLARAAGRYCESPVALSVAFDSNCETTVTMRLIRSQLLPFLSPPAA
ncbi:hypothetical protein HDU84_001777 [Entophlyctis sp. JEL0112]|nr:hypothetical protein HDU84_001777 [Entophlyctis sp. JEL0112]